MLRFVDNIALLVISKEYLAKAYIDRNEQNPNKKL